MRKQTHIARTPPAAMRPNPQPIVPATAIRRETFLGRTHQTHVSVDAAELQRRLAQATIGLSRKHPDLSAKHGAWLWQRILIALLAGLTVGGLAIAPGAAIALLTALVTLPFLGVALVRLVALAGMFKRSSTASTTVPLPDALLPTYTVIVPMYDEAAVLPHMIDALSRLDYPPEKLELMLVLEEVDTRTRDALAGLPIPPNMHIILTPNSQPRTKPKATNFALTYASGDFLVVYDAEDRPEPDQLRQAAAAFATGNATLAYTINGVSGSKAIERVRFGPPDATPVVSFAPRTTPRASQDIPWSPHSITTAAVPSRRCSRLLKVTSVRR